MHVCVLRVSVLLVKPCEWTAREGESSQGLRRERLAEVLREVPIALRIGPGNALVIQLSSKKFFQLIHK